MVFQYADPEGDLGPRARQLAGCLSMNGRETLKEAQIPLKEVLNRLHL